MASIKRKTKRYPTDLMGAEWMTLAPFSPKPADGASSQKTFHPDRRPIRVSPLRAAEAV
jgi:hypothetical protein